MTAFIIILVVFAGLFLLFGLMQYIGTAVRKKQYSKLLGEVSDLFKESRYISDISLPLGLFLSVNHDKNIEDVYNNPKNLEIAQKTVLNMLSRG